MADWDEDSLAPLRAGAYRRDPRAWRSVLAGRPLGPVLQLAGDVLVAALERDGPGSGAGERARTCVEELEGRGEAGDAELAAELTAALEGTRGELADVPVDLGALGARLDADPAEGVQVVDLRTGDIGPADDAEGAPEAGGPGESGGGRHLLAFVPAGTGSSEERRRGAARAWLAAHGYRSRPRFL